MAVRYLNDIETKSFDEGNNYVILSNFRVIAEGIYYNEDGEATSDDNVVEIVELNYDAENVLNVTNNGWNINVKCNNLEAKIKALDDLDGIQAEVCCDIYEYVKKADKQYITKKFSIASSSILTNISENEIKELVLDFNNIYLLKQLKYFEALIYISSDESFLLKRRTLTSIIEQYEINADLDLLLELDEITTLEEFNEKITPHIGKKITEHIFGSAYDKDLCLKFIKNSPYLSHNCKLAYQVIYYDENVR